MERLPTNRHSGNDRSDPPEWNLLALCARPRLPEGSGAELEARVAAIGDWDAALASAEYHGVGPLLHSHLHDRSHLLTQTVVRQLKAIYLRHRRSNEVRLRVLAEVLEALRTVEIEPTVLKGAALIPLVYEDPGLRPLADLDLLVPEKEVVRAQRRLREIGFAAPMPGPRGDRRRGHHLAAATRTVDGVPVHVEIHRNAFSAESGASLTLEGRSPGAMRFEVAGCPALGLGPEEMLWHLCRHLHKFRLIWMADIVGFAERFVDTIDWARVAVRYPFVTNALACIHCLVPHAEAVVSRAGIVAMPRPRDAGRPYLGWPGAPALVWDGVGGRLRFLGRTLSPPEWWLRFYYGSGNRPIGLWAARARHTAMLVRSLIRRAAGLVLRRRSRGPSVED